MSPQPKHPSLALQLIGFLILIFIPACQAATPTVPPTASNQHLTTTQPPATAAIVTPAPSETSITPSTTTQFIPKVEVQIAAQVGGEVTDIEINGTYAYLAVGPRLVVMDLSNPDILQVASMSDLLPGLGKALALEGGRLCWVSDNGYLLVFTLEDPTKPSLLGQYEIPQKADEIVIKDGIAWVGFLNEDSEGLRAYDLNSVSEHTLEEIAKVNTHVGHGSSVLAGNYLYLYGGFVIDISNPRQPTMIKISKSLNSPTDADYTAFVPPYAYIYGWKPRDENSTKRQAHWQVWDISDPDHPNQVGDVPDDWNQNYWFSLGPGTIDGKRMYSFISEGMAGDITLSCPYHLEVTDISDPANPQIIASPDQLQLHCVRDVKAVGNRLYVVDWHGLSLVDIRNLAAPRVLDRFGSPPQIEGMALKGDFLFAGTDFRENSLNVFNVSTTHPPDFAGSSLLGSAPYLSVYEAYPPGTASGLAVAGDYLFVPQRNEGLSVVDISQPRLPKVVVHDPNIGNQSGYVQRAAVVGQTLFLTINREQVAMVDIQDPTRPRSLGMLPGISSVYDLASADGLLYILGGDPGTFIVLNVEDPLTPKEITRVSFSLGSSGARLSITGKRAYISGVGSGTKSGLTIFDLSDPTDPKQVGMMAGFDNVWDVAGQGDTIMVACASYFVSDIWVVDAKNPSQPELVGHFKTPGMSPRVVADDTFFYLSANQGGLWKLKVADLK
jgi:hypothetical protein